MWEVSALERRPAKADMATKLIARLERAQHCRSSHRQHGVVGTKPAGSSIAQSLGLGAVSGDEGSARLFLDTAECLTELTVIPPTVI